MWLRSLITAWLINWTLVLWVFWRLRDLRRHAWLAFHDHGVWMVVFFALSVFSTALIVKCVLDKWSKAKTGDRLELMQNQLAGRASG